MEPDAQMPAHRRGPQHGGAGRGEGPAVNDVAPGMKLRRRAAGLRVLAIVRSQETSNALAAAISSLEGVELDLRIGELKTTGAQAVYVEGPDVVVLDVDVDDQQDMWLLSRIVHERASVGPVLATAAAVNAEGVRRLVRQGVDDFIPQPLTQRDVLDAIEVAQRKLRQIRSAGRRLGRVVSFLKAAGGMGSTTLALHVAYNLLHPDKERRAEVCVLDLDLHFGTAALQMDLDAKPEILEIINAPGRLDGDFLRGAMAVHRSGLHVLTAPAPAVPLDALSAETVEKLLTVAREEYDFVVVDLPPVLTGWLDLVLGSSDQIFLVTQLSVPAIGQSRRLLDLLGDEGLYNLPLAVVLNRYRRRWGERVRLRESEKALGRRFDHLIGSDYRLMVDALNQGKPLYEIRRWSRVGRQIRGMTRAWLASASAREPQAAASALAATPAA
jgi:pilus assembly protein CpaE